MIETYIALLLVMVGVIHHLHADDAIHKGGMIETNSKVFTKKESDTKEK